MKKITILLILVTTSLFSQNFDTELEHVAKRMAQKLNTKNKMNVAVYPFYNSKRVKTDLSVLVSEDFTNYLNNYNKAFKIIDRAYLEQMMEEHQLNEEGLIDPATAKQFGMIIAADVYITGKVHLFANSIRLNIVAINTQTGERICSEYKKLTLDYDIAEFLGVNLKKVKEDEKMYKSSNPDCKLKEVGDFCFVNKTSSNLNIRITTELHSYRSFRSISIAPNEKKCFLNLAANKTYFYTATKDVISIGEPLIKGEFTVKTCLSDFILLK